jgi:hypothetical protein
VGPSSEAERAAALSIPAWITGAFAIGTIAGLIGSVGLFLRQRWAHPVLIVSFTALLVLADAGDFNSGYLHMPTSEPALAR